MGLVWLGFTVIVTSTVTTMGVAFACAEFALSPDAFAADTT
jgi:hypothetical protein